MTIQEFQAVVLAAGRGTRVPDITGDRPKCLLPIGPLPLLWYPLQMLQKHNFQDAIVIVLDTQKVEIQQAIDRTPLKLKIDYVSIPSDSDFGTADALRHIKDKIRRDVLIVSCDTILDVSLYPLFDVFRQHDASVASLMFRNNPELDFVLPGPKTKSKPERDLIGIQPDTNRLVFLSSTSDFEETMKIPGHMLRKNGKVVIHSRLVDSHIYLIKEWIVKFLGEDENKSFSTIKGELIPFIVKKQMCRRQDERSDPDKALSEANATHEDIYDYVEKDKLKSTITKKSLFNDSVSKKPYHSDEIRCFAIQAPSDSFGLRVNTMQMFCAANKNIIKYWEKLVGPSIPLISPSSINNSTQSNFCAVAENALISEKTSVNNSVIGCNTVVKPKTRILNSIIMNNVTIEEGVVIEDSIICDRVVVNSGSVLKSCLVGNNYIVAEHTDHEKAHLTKDGYMEIE